MKAVKEVEKWLVSMFDMVNGERRFKILHAGNSSLEESAQSKLNSVFPPTFLWLSLTAETHQTHQYHITRRAKRNLPLHRGAGLFSDRR